MAKLLSLEELNTILAAKGMGSVGKFQLRGKTLFHDQISLLHYECEKDLYFQKVKKTPQGTYEPIDKYIMVYRLRSDANYELRDKIYFDGQVEPKYVYKLSEAELFYDETPKNASTELYSEKVEDGKKAAPSVEMAETNFPLSQVPLRAWAAVQLKVPDSGITWLDEMIKKAPKK